jgi:2-isopropylmalate synthase
LSRRVAIFDTTLRDGEQSVGVALSPADKVEIATALEQLGVGVIEAGFPATSEAEFEAVRAVAEAVRRPVVAAMARAAEGDVTAAAEALAGATRSRLHLVVGTSDVHLELKLGLSRDELLDLAVRTTRLARPLFDEVEFCCEDAARSDRGFLREVCAAVVEEGADVVNLPDTVGFAVPGEYAGMFRTLGVSAVLSAHCHDDLGLATANTVAAVDAGAGQVECTINGIGERAGNAALEEVVAALELGGYETGIDMSRLPDVSRLVSKLTGYAVAPHKAIVGANASGSSSSSRRSTS